MTLNIITQTKGSNASTLNKNNNNDNVYLYSLLLTMKILKVELEYWLLGITTGARGAIQPLDISIK